MVQRKAPNKLRIKPRHLKLDSQLENLKPSSSSPSLSSQTHEKIKKIMKKSRSIKRPDESRQLHPASSPASPQKQSPNYMKSTSSFDARKEQSPRTPITKGLKDGSRTSSLKIVRNLTKTPSFKLLRSSKKVILCEDGEAQRATCSSTLKDSKFPNYLQLNPGGTELDGTSTMKVCPYSYCSLNGHRHAPVPPLKSFLSARRRGLKTQKSFKLGCLSPRKIMPAVKQIDVNKPVISATEEVNLKEENDEDRDFFVHIYSQNRGRKSNQDLEDSDIDWEEGCCSDSGINDFKLQEKDGGVVEDHGSYDEESVSSGAWSEEDGETASHGSMQQMKTGEGRLNFDEFEVASTTDESKISEKIDEIHSINQPIGDQCTINHQEDEASHESKTIPDFAEESKDGTEKNRTTVIYNIIQFNISVFINGEKTEHTETDKIVAVQETATSIAAGGMEAEEAMEDNCMSRKDDETSNQNQTVRDEAENVDKAEQECSEYEACNESNSMEEPATRSDVDQTEAKDEITSETVNSASIDNLQDLSTNLRQLTINKKPSQEIVDDDSLEFNPRGPNFLPESPDPDAETVDLRHQMIDERKNAEEWMVDFALQQTVTKLAPARKRKVALLVEAFEKVMPDPIPMYEPDNRYTSKAFTNSRPMQACS